MRPCSDIKADAAGIAIVGAGPAGLMAAIAAAGSGARVTVCEQLAEPGRKLLASGGGRCNFTNTLDTGEFIKRFGRKSRFVAPALKAFGGASLRLFLESLGVPSRCEDGFHVFPSSGSAATVRNALARACRAAGAELKFASRVESIAVEQEKITGIATARGFEPAGAVVLCAGGAGYPDLGGGSGAFDLARRAGHAIEPPCPALTPLLTRETWPAALAGMTLSDVSISLAAPLRMPEQSRGGLVFTHTGLSGPAALDISGAISRALAARNEVALLLDLAPAEPLGAWEEKMAQWRAAQGAKTVVALLRRAMPAALAEIVAALAGIAPDIRMARLGRDGQRRLAALARALPLTVTGTGGFDKAMVTRGGVALDEIDPKTLESKIVRGLFFAGEVADVDGPCGGFNLQWAFSSGRLAGLSAARRRAAV